MQVVRPIYCKHEPKQEVEVDGEIVCGCCGFVKGRDTPTCVSSKSRTNLAQDYQLGGKTTGHFMSEKFVNPHTELSIISNICEGLALPSYISHDVWKWYQKINPLLNMTKAKIIFLIIYTMCRYNVVTLNEKELSKAIQMFLHVKNSPNSLKVISKSLSYLDKEGKPILEKIGFTEFLKNNPNFLLFNKLKSLERKYPHELIEQVKNVYFETLPKTTNLQSVKKAIQVAMSRCGVC